MASQVAYEYHTSCVESTAKQIDAMMDAAEEITYEALIRAVGRGKVAAIFPFCEWGTGDGLRLKDDYAVSYYRGQYNGYPACIIQHSLIEYIFIARGKKRGG